MVGFAIFGIIALYLLLCVAIGFLRGLTKQRIRCIIVACCAVVALVSVLITKAQVTSDQVTNLTNQFGSETIEEFLELSPTLTDALSGCALSLMTPILFLGVFIALCIVTWVIYLIVTIILHHTLAEHTRNSSHRILRTVILSAVQGLIGVIVFMLPIAVYTGVAPTVMESIDAAEEMSGETLLEDREMVDNVIDDYVTPINESAAFKGYNAIGGKALAKWLTDFKVGDKNVHLNDEIGAISQFGCDIWALSKTKMEDYGPNQSVLFHAMADSFEGSELLPTVVGEVIYHSADAWLHGEKFIGASKPSLGETFDPFFDKMLEILKKDSENTESVKAAFGTLADMISVLADHRVFGALDDDDALIKKLGAEGTVADVIAVLEKNESMKALIPEITNMGMRAIAQKLGITEEGLSQYEDFLGDIADALNETAGSPEQIAELTDRLVDAFDEAGVEIAPEIISSYSEKLIADLGSGEITQDDVRKYFADFAENGDPSLLANLPQ